LPNGWNVAIPFHLNLKHLICQEYEDFSLKLILNIYLTKEYIEFNNYSIMKVRCSLKTAKNRDKDCKLVRRKGRIYVINKKNPRMKARQG